MESLLAVWKKDADAVVREHFSLLDKSLSLLQEFLETFPVFGTVNRLPQTIEWLTDNGSCFIAGPTRRFARLNHGQEVVRQDLSARLQQVRHRHPFVTTPPGDTSQILQGL